MFEHNLKLLPLLRHLVNFSALLALLLALVGCQLSAGTSDDGVAAGFVELRKIIPTVVFDVRYAGTDNFVGAPITGYHAPVVYVTAATAAALGDVQRALATSGLGLKVFDGYRPQRAVNHFVRWAKDLNDTRMQSRYYPSVAKQNLFRDGYIAERSGHSRGSTVDLTLIRLDTGQELDMGSPWDFFDPVSWPDSKAVTAAQFDNRMRLQQVMMQNGFDPLSTEWWHFTLRGEPFPETYFDFPICE